MKKTAMLAALAAACALGGAAGAQAQDFPGKPVTILIPFPPGTGNDLVGRIVGNKLSEIIGQRVVAENRAGASGNIAVDATRRSSPDGYTMVVASTSFSLNLYTTKSNFTLNDFTPVALIGKLPYTLMVGKGVPAKNMKELADLLKSKPGQLTAGQGGPTGSTFFLLESFKRAAGFDVPVAVYKGTIDGVQDLLADRTQMMFAPMVTSLPQYRENRIQLHGVTGSKRSVLMPNVPTFTEQGLPTLDIPTWFGFLGPAGIPRGPVKLLSDGVAKALTSKDVIDALMNQGVEPGFAAQADFDAFLKADTAMWARLVKESGVKPQ